MYRTIGQKPQTKEDKIIKYSARVVLSVTATLGITFSKEARAHVEQSGSIMGCIDTENKDMWIRPESPLYVWLHEWAHLLLGHNETSPMIPVEFEADAVALAIYDKLGIETQYIPLLIQRMAMLDIKYEDMRRRIRRPMVIQVANEIIRLLKEAQ